MNSSLLPNACQYESCRGRIRTRFSLKTVNYQPHSRLKIPPVTSENISTGGRLSLRLLMDDDEDDVFQRIPICWNTHFREIKYEDRGTQTPSPALGQGDNMLPCGVAQEPRRLFYGNAGFRLHFPARFEHVGDQEQEEEGQGEAERSAEQPALSAEVRIGQKLQMIGDQFHQEHLQLYHRNQRNQQPAWWRLAIALYTLLFEREGVARRQRPDQR
ncbi:hypothetical protein MATL_G00163840 [Megalops atlanticus]|uniref:Bcl-2-modifying factor n=1 Tax=Megalops atlanticus TaxID=7932 RepID=A0A9D3PVD2_MEGAT|nr:hypothetical protein MATL_G00163840 [Megalops atlanticus]